jgi:hypothetical protein
MKNCTVRLISFTLLILLAVSALVACSSEIQRKEIAIELLADDSNGKYYYEKSEYEALANIKTEFQHRTGKQFEGTIISFMIFADNKTDKYCSIIIFEKESDAKLLQASSSAAFKNDYIVRKGNVVYVGNENIINYVIDNT